VDPRFAKLLAAIRAEPGRADLYERLARRALELDRWPQAVEAMARSLELDPRDDEERRYLLAAAQMHAGEVAHAEENFRALLAADSDNPKLLFGLAPVLTAQGEFGEAAVLLRRVIDAEPGHAAAW
jgi:tetratricopeptide (TPR) repeat protein